MSSLAGFILCCCNCGGQSSEGLRRMRGGLDEGRLGIPSRDLTLWLKMDRCHSWWCLSPLTLNIIESRCCWLVKHQTLILVYNCIYSLFALLNVVSWQSLLVGSWVLLRVIWIGLLNCRLQTQVALGKPTSKEKVLRWSWCLNHSVSSSRGRVLKVIFF